MTRASHTTNQMEEDGTGDDGIYHTRTHTGRYPAAGDTVLGYHLTNSNFNNDAFEGLDESRIPDVILVRKTYPNRRRKAKPRNWKLRSIAKEPRTSPRAPTRTVEARSVAEAATTSETSSAITSTSSSRSKRTLRCVPRSISTAPSNGQRPLRSQTPTATSVWARVRLPPARLAQAFAAAIGGLEPPRLRLPQQLLPRAWMFEDDGMASEGEGEEDGYHGEDDDDEDDEEDGFQGVGLDELLEDLDALELGADEPRRSCNLVYICAVQSVSALSSHCMCP